MMRFSGLPTGGGGGCSGHDLFGRQRDDASVAGGARRDAAVAARGVCESLGFLCGGETGAPGDRTGPRASGDADRGGAGGNRLHRLRHRERQHRVAFARRADGAGERGGFRHRTQRRAEVRGKSNA